ncbi:MAG TPA: hypothetical protein VJ570_09940 [Holophagaceae bacterium]|nr:hypothetical protein [Holophagaceae bacterium]
MGFALGCGGGGGATSGTAPTFTLQPQNQVLAAGETATFSVAATGDPAPTLQWERSNDGGGTWAPLGGATQPSYAFVAQAGDHGARFRATARNSAGSRPSDAAQLVVNSAPLFTLEPVDAVLGAGQSAVFTAAVAGYPTPLLQWERSDDGGMTWSPLAGAQSSTYTRVTQANDHGARFRIRAFNGVGASVSAPAELRLLAPPDAPPAFTLQPGFRTVPAGRSVRWFAAALGNPAPAFGWERSDDGGLTWNAVVGASGPTYTFIAQTTDHLAQFRAVATNAGGTAHGNPAQLVVTEPAPPVAAGETGSLVIHADGTLWATGANDWGSLGLGDSVARTRFTQGIGEVNALARGLGSSAVVRGEGELWAAGENVSGETGATWLFSDHFQQVLEGCSHVTASNNHALVVKSDGTLWATGLNISGVLGSGDDRTAFGRLLTGVVDVGTNAFHTLVIKADGSVWGTGRNGVGQLGNANPYDSNGFVESFAWLGPGTLVPFSGVVAVSAGFNHSLVLKGDGTLWASGSNAQGQLGAGAAVPQTLVFTQVLDGVVAMAAGGAHSLALKADGTVWATGSNASGQLGTGDGLDHATFVQVAEGVAHLAAGEDYSLLVKLDGTLWAAGGNRYGQLGTGDTLGQPRFVSVDSGVRATAPGPLRLSLP